MAANPRVIGLLLLPAFSHLAMSEQTDKGEGTAWFEHVSDTDYNAAPAPVT